MNKKFKRVAEGINPMLSWAPSILFTIIWLYSINNNWWLYGIGIVGCIISGLNAIDSIAYRKVYWVEDKK